MMLGTTNITFIVASLLRWYILMSGGWTLMHSWLVNWRNSGQERTDRRLTELGLPLSGRNGLSIRKAALEELIHARRALLTDTWNLLWFNCLRVTSGAVWWDLIRLRTISQGTRRRTALQAGRSWVRFPMVSLEFFIDIILPITLWPWSWLSL